jgi:hypothetical protein
VKSVCETYFLILRKDKKLEVSGNKLLRTLSEPKKNEVSEQLGYQLATCYKTRNSVIYRGHLVLLEWWNLGDCDELDMWLQPGAKDCTKIATQKIKEEMEG